MWSYREKYAVVFFFKRVASNISHIWNFINNEKLLSFNSGVGSHLTHKLQEKRNNRKKRSAAQLFRHSRRAKHFSDYLAHVAHLLFNVLSTRYASGVYYRSQKTFSIKNYWKYFVARGFRRDENVGIFPRTIYWKNLIIILLDLRELHFFSVLLSMHSN